MSKRLDSQTYVAQLQWFEVGRYTASTVLWAKLLQIPAAVKRDNHFAILTLQARCNERTCEDSLDALMAAARSEERRVGKECRGRWWAEAEKKKKEKERRRGETTDGNAESRE